ncbi:hypothetical protein [Limnoglobus roseus]|uniref:Uncharacterized protein n=1 Tax=Limnoglobus roseus TaxID=2598579 RepID=A0A5C1AEH9_9BACT|nr:hypothetical protein [Limnoglobus roseus]QEL17140.1 hypothetical protein PX52LOC_04121 [Limnoglobus roseus]
MSDNLFTISGEVQIKRVDDVLVIETSIGRGQKGLRTIAQVAATAKREGMPVDLPAFDDDHRKKAVDALMVAAGFYPDEDASLATRTVWVPWEGASAYCESLPRVGRPRFHLRRRR